MISISAQNRVAGEEAESRTTEALVFPTIGTLLATAAVASVVCRTPDQPFASWGRLLTRAVGYLLLAAAAHAAAITLICRVYRDQLRAPVRRILRGTWLCAALLPVTVLLAHAGSEWAAVMLPMIAVLAVMFVRRAAPGVGRSAHTVAPAGVAAGLFAYEAPATLMQTLWPMALVAVMLELGVVMLASWEYSLAGLLFGMCVTVVLWKTPLRPRVAAGEESSPPVGRATVVALLLTIAALLPSLGGSRMAGMVGRFVGFAPVLPKTAPPQVRNGPALSGALSGVILTLPPKPREKLMPPAPKSTLPTMGMSRRVQKIPFDGAYWYFRSLELQPREDAKRVQGDPTKVDIHSTDMVALEMEAHQRLDTPIGTDCCSAIRVTVRNAEEREGAIALELVLAEDLPKSGWRRSLGRMTLESSLTQHGAGDGVEEVLEFAVPEDLPRGEFNEMMLVVVVPAGERARRGARVRIENFELVGR